MRKRECYRISPRCGMYCAPRAWLAVLVGIDSDKPHTSELGITLRLRETGLNNVRMSLLRASPQEPTQAPSLADSKPTLPAEGYPHIQRYVLTVVDAE